MSNVVKTHDKFGLHRRRGRWYWWFSLTKLVHRIPTLLFLDRRIGPWLQLSGTEYRVKYDTEKMNAGGDDEYVSPLFGSLKRRSFMK